MPKLPTLAAVALTVGLAAADDWPHPRGPHFDGTSAERGLADTWPVGGPPVRWARDLGPGYAGVAVAAGRAFTLFQTATAMYLTAVDAATGGELWRTRVDRPWQPGGLYPGPYAAPAAAAGRVYFATPSGQVGAADAADGRVLWAVDVRTTFGGRGTGFGFAATPLVDGDRVIVPVGGEGAGLVALAAADGSTAWKAGDDPASYCPARPIAVGGRRLVVGYMKNSLVLHDPTTGRRVWRARLSDGYDEHAAWPLFDGRHLLIAAPFKVGCRAFRLAADGDTVTGTPAWAGRPSNDVCSSLLADGAVYGFDLVQAQATTHRPSRGTFVCVDAATGKLRWETAAVGQGTPLAADGKLLVWVETGELVLARLDPSRYVELGRAQVLTGGGMCWPPPAVAGRRLFVRDHERLACVDLADPAASGPTPPPREVAAVPVRPRAWAFDWSRLTPREPDFPNDAPTAAEVGRWFGWCGGLAGLAAAIATAVRAAAGRGWRPAFGGAAFVLGAVGTTAIGAWADEFALTWPLAVYAAFRAVVGRGVGRAAGRGRKARAAARLGLLAFAGLCYGYVEACRAVGFAVGWAFLIGLPPVVPLAVAAARTGRGWVRWPADGLGFAAYFWAGGLIPGLTAAAAD